MHTIDTIDIKSPEDIKTYSAMGATLNPEGGLRRVIYKATEKI